MDPALQVAFATRRGVQLCRKVCRVLRGWRAGGRDARIYTHMSLVPNKGRGYTVGEEEEISPHPSLLTSCHCCCCNKAALLSLQFLLQQQLSQPLLHTAKICCSVAGALSNAKFAVVGGDPTSFVHVGLSLALSLEDTFHFYNLTPPTTYY